MIGNLRMWIKSVYKTAHLYVFDHSTWVWLARGTWRDVHGLDDFVEVERPHE